MLYLLALFGAASAASSYFDYVSGSGYAPEDWGNNVATCAGQSHSPIDIVTADLVYSPQELDLSFPGVMTVDLHNNGHSTSIGLGMDSTTSDAFEDPNMYVIERIDGVENNFHTLGFHFHWGAVDTEGSEHTRDGVMYPLELHIVNALNPDDLAEGLLVLGVFFEIGEENPDLQPIIEAVTDLAGTVPNNATHTIDLVLNNLIPDTAATQYTHYSGSLTTPDSNEIVHWKNAIDTLTVSSSQMEAFRQLNFIDQNGEMQLLTQNWRPVQDLNGRTVYTTVDGVGATSDDSDELTGDGTQVFIFSAIMTVLICLILLGAAIMYTKEYLRKKAKKKQKAIDDAKRAQKQKKYKAEEAAGKHSV